VVVLALKEPLDDGVRLALSVAEAVALGPSEGLALALGAPQLSVLPFHATPSAQRGVRTMRVQEGPRARGGTGHTGASCALPQLAPK
jgi:hypothetical protein